MKRDTHYMIDIETTGTTESDDILEIGMVEIVLHPDVGNYWLPTGRQYHTYIGTTRQPESQFAKQHQKELYAKCNSIITDIELIKREITEFVHPEVRPGNPDSDGLIRPKFFMGWNASNFDIPFMFRDRLLTPSYYVVNPETNKEEMFGDVHYRIYEQTGSVQLLADMTGLDRKTIEVLAMDLNPTNIKLPEGKAHDALYDCYKQIIMQNGLIRIGRMGIRK